MLCFRFIFGRVLLCINRVGNGNNLVSLCERAIFGQLLQPVATSHKIYSSPSVNRLFFSKNPVGEIVIRCSLQIRAISAGMLKVCTRSGVMADARKRPHIVHGPYYFFSGSKDLPNFVQRQHSLVDPMQMNDIGRFEFRKFSYRGSPVGNGDIE
ncbi:hypothetical protein SDC9_174836 [bioreactor metagenome]|uniref:Uncharacterized protein n=1 Tax=bioreactor metagenome TaxID=1076179 RepID=A0A645GTN8_9ZZZZ